MTKPVDNYHERSQWVFPPWALGIFSAQVANLVAVPFSAIFTRIADDTKRKKSFWSLYKDMGQQILRGDIQAIFRGGVARGGQKLWAPVAMAYLPKKFSNDHEFLSRGIAGALVAILANPFKMAQTLKVSQNQPYPQTVKWLVTREGIKAYLSNTRVFMVGEGARCACLFGTNAYVQKLMNRKADDPWQRKVMTTLVPAGMAAVIESGVACGYEAWTVVHVSKRAVGQNPPSSEGKGVREVFQREWGFIQKNGMNELPYLRRIFGGAFIKNGLANIPLLFITNCIADMRASGRLH